ncbi:MAG: rRNA methyltransferase [Acidimicrobiales bacterium mtb01]|nr:RNA methyltransferase [Actinomycetota bacterium]TEX45036.1 MAG: rRNA methyltransferase [Acidimicrobiales bacterium mtb01]
MSTGLGLTNQHVQRLRRLIGRRSSRIEENALVIDGPVLVAEAVAAGLEFEAQFLAPDAPPVPGAGTVHRLADGVLEKVADTESPNGIVAIARRRSSSSDVLATASFVVVADGVADPGNLGTIMRSAEAAGADALVITAGTVDPTNPKCVRASAGSLFRLPMVEVESIAAIGSGLVIVGTSSHEGVDMWSFDFTRRVAIVVGREAHGMSSDSPVDEWVSIPQTGRTESLNVAMAATVLCFEVARQRRGRNGTV